MLEPRPRLFPPQPERFGAADGCMWVTCIRPIYVQANIYPRGNIAGLKNRSNGVRTVERCLACEADSPDTRVGRGSRAITDVCGELSLEQIHALLDRNARRAG